MRRNLCDIDDVIYVQRTKSIHHFLKHFGQSISRLTLEHGSSQELLLHSSTFNVVSTINELINFHCSNSLVELKIENYYANFFEEMTRPFKYVENITITGWFEKLGTSTLTFDELFPAIKQLTLTNVKVISPKSIARRFPHLEYLQIEVSGSFLECDVEAVLQMNSQIRILNLDGISRHLLRVVSENLPKLDTLEFHPSVAGFTFDNSNKERTIVFNSVRILSIFTPNIMNNIIFNNVVELHTMAISMGAGNQISWMEFIEKNTDLKQLHLHKVCIDAEQLQELVSANLSLDKITLELCTGVDDEAMAGFVENSGNIQQFSIRKHPLIDAQETCQVLQERLGNNVKIVDNKFEISIERVNN